MKGDIVNNYILLTMQKNIIYLRKNLRITKKKTLKKPNLETSSTKDLIKYKKLILQQQQLEKEIKKLLLLQKQIIEKYNLKNQKLMTNNSINVRKYCKLEEKEHYKMEKKLYKLGFSKQKPIPPFLNSIKNFLAPYREKLDENFQNSNLNKKIHSLKIFKKQTLPDFLTNFAIKKTKQCIIGYRKFKSTQKKFMSKFSQNPIFTQFHKIKTEALQQLDNNSTSFIPKAKVNEQIALRNCNLYKNSPPDFEIAL